MVLAATSEQAFASTQTGQLAKVWQEAQALLSTETIIELRPYSYNKGGLLVTWNQLIGFVPASQLVGLPQLHLPQERLAHLQERLQQTVRLKLIEADPQRKRLVFSERAAQTEGQKRQQLWETLRPGSRLTGTITNLADFGAFVDLGGVEGLIHISQLSWQRLLHPSDIVQPGQVVEVLVLRCEPGSQRVALSMKQLRPDPWQRVAERYRPGQIVTGIVSNVVNFGVFVLLEEGLEGLIHNLELNGKPTFGKGDAVRSKVLQVDGLNRRLALTLREIPS